MKLENFVLLLTNHLSIPVHADVVPESATRPAVSYVNISNPFERGMDGRKYGKQEMYRVTIEGRNTSEIVDIVKELDLLDNTATASFSKIQCELINIEGKDEEAIYKRAFVDFKVT